MNRETFVDEQFDSCQFMIDNCEESQDLMILAVGFDDVFGSSTFTWSHNTSCRLENMSWRGVKILQFRVIFVHCQLFWYHFRGEKKLFQSSNFIFSSSDTSTTRKVSFFGLMLFCMAISSYKMINKKEIRVVRGLNRLSKKWWDSNFSCRKKRLKL